MRATPVPPSPDPVEEALQAARIERPGDAARLRTLAALGLGTAATITAASSASAATATSTAAAAAPAAATTATTAATAAPAAAASTASTAATTVTALATKGLVAKLAVGGILAGLTATVWTSSIDTKPRPLASPTALPALAVSASVSALVTAPQAPPPQDQPAVASASASVSEPSAAPVLAPRASYTAPAKASAEPSIEDEIKAINPVRAAIQQRNASAAFAALDAYEKNFPRGRFSWEVPVLRMEALAIENPTTAKQLAREYLERHPNSVLASRLKNAVGLEP